MPDKNNPDPTPTANNDSVVVMLESPINRGEQTYSEVTLMKPKAGQLRGLNLQDLVNSDVTAVITLVPRISNPALVADDLEKMDLPDFTEIAGAISGFFMSQGMKEYVAKMTGQTT